MEVQLLKLELSPFLQREREKRCFVRAKVDLNFELGHFSSKKKGLKQGVWC